MRALQSLPRRAMALLGILPVTIVTLVVYYPALQIGFFTDDYEFVEPAGRLNWQEYLSTYFDPRLQWHWYRPLQGLDWRFAYMLFGSNAGGYHLLQLLLHLANCLLLYGLIARMTRKWPVALLAALIYASLPTSSLAVLWPAVADPLVAVFYLLTVWFWLDYVESGSRWGLALAIGSFVAALLTKETAAVLPIVLFLADRWLVGKPIALAQLAKRYAFFVIALGLYGLLELRVLTRGVFTSSLGYGVGGQIPSTLLYHLTWLTFPWGLEPPLNYAWLLVVLVVLGWAIYRRKRRLWLLAAATVLPVLPILPFPTGIASATRYLYLPLMGSAVGVALIVGGALKVVGKLERRWLATVPLALVALATIGGGAAVAESAQGLAGITRASRLSFSSIFQRHAAFAPDTLLYFVDPGADDISGIMFLRYGAGVTVGSVQSAKIAQLDTHQAGFVFYLDDAKVWQEQAVAKTTTATAPGLPVRFSDSISLEGLELVNDHIKRGDALIAILYWQANGKIAKDYTVFAHLVNEKGQMVAGADSPPRRGAAPTSSWHTDTLIPDGLVFPTDTSIPPGQYRLEIGLYDLATMQRLSILDANGQPLSDKLVVKTIWITQ